jgi:hypothetical protein
MEPWYLRFIGAKGYSQPYGIPTTYQSQMSGDGSTTLSGYVQDTESKDEMIGAAVKLLRSGTQVAVCITDLDGYYRFMGVSPGTYDMEVSYIGYNTEKVTYINVAGGRANSVNFELTEGASISEVVITAYKVPLIEMDGMSGSTYSSSSAGGSVGTGGGTITSEQIRNLPNKSIGYTAAGQDRGDVTVRGSRSGNATSYYIDGTRVSGALIPETNLEEKTTTVNFVIEDPYTIKPDGKYRTVEVKNEEIAAEYAYYVAPRLEEAAFLTARIADWERLNLLDGDISLFFEGTYLGKTRLSLANASDTLALSLGRDQSVKVSRTRVTDFSRRQFIGDKQTVKRAYDIEIRNTKRSNISLTIEDQFPISTDNAISITQDEASKGSINPDTGIVTWRTTLAPNAIQTYRLAFSVKYPKGKQLNSSEL